MSLPTDDATRMAVEDPADSKLRWDEDDHWIKAKLETCVRKALGRPGLPAEAIMPLGALLWLVERLPEHFGGYTAVLTFSQDREDGVASWCLRYDEAGLKFELDEMMRGEWGSDHHSVDVLTITTHGKHDRLDAPHHSDWLDEFCQHAGDPEYELSIEWYPDLEMPGGEAVV